MIAGVSDDSFNVVRVDAESGAVGLLDYPAFFDHPFPSLARSWKVALDSNDASYRTYIESQNPPILHRKELLLRPSDQRRQRYAQLTSQLESVGLFDDPVRIGFRMQWERLLAERGFRIVGHELVPIGNDENPVEPLLAVGELPSIQRHRTALTRYSLSAPIQLLNKHGFLDGSFTVLDYGCGKGDDVRGLRDNGIAAEGWDPYFAPDNPVDEADVVNLGFVINVIEDPVERREALQRAFALTRQVLAVSVMIATENSVRGTPFADGVMTGRNTFQKYFTQSELREYLEAALQGTAIPVAPGIAFVFRNEDAEQRFQTGRLRSSLRLRPAPREPRSPRQPRVPSERRVRPDKFEEHRELLDALWRCCLELGREPEPDEVPQRQLLEDAVGSVPKGLRIVRANMGAADFELARAQRTDDLKVYFALQLFRSRQPYGRLESRLQRDVKAFFGSYTAAISEGRELLLQAAREGVLNEAAKRASEQGLGWLDPSGYLQFHSALVPRLPTVLRAYVGCASVLYGDLESADLVKIHLRSGKVSLMTFDDFGGLALPRMTYRVKVNLRTQNVSVFQYGDEYEPPFLYLKSRFLNEESPNFAEQMAFDEALQALELFDLSGFGPAPDEFLGSLHDAHWTINSYSLERLHYVPELDAQCGRYLTYRQLIECGETQQQLALPNLPQEAPSYTALYDLAVNILDPVIEYFGNIELTYGFCSAGLAKQIGGRIAPKLDQHAAHERKRDGAPICDRLGAAVDFLVRDEDMREVVDWIAKSLPFDRVYYYGEHSPIHVSYGPQEAREIVDVLPTASGQRMPRVRKCGAG
jgi:DNA phosphorothioation-associated putative methyltransferase